MNALKNLMNLVLISKYRWEWPKKIVKVKKSAEKTYIRVSQAKSKPRGQDSTGSRKRGFFCHIFILFHFLMEKDLL